MKAALTLLAGATLLVLPSAADATVAGWQSMDPPAAAASMAPWLLVDGADLLLSWIEGPTGAGEPHRLRMSRFERSSWSAPVSIASGTDLFVNWADTPGLGRAGNGDLYAHWLRRLGGGTYAYGVEIGRSRDRGATWTNLGFVHEDRSPTEHGFVTWAAEDQGIRVAWLDGRETTNGGAMTLRSTRVGETVEASERIDDRVCDCCSTAMVATPRGAVVIYRDRSAEEIRDIAASRRGVDSWSPPQPVHADGWKIEGCPVNGPQVVAGSGDRLAVAWFTDAPPAGDQERSRLRIAFSTDAGASFGPTFSLAGDGTMGRVGLATVAPLEVIVTWLASTEAGAEIRARRVAADGRLGEVISLVGTTASRASGIPRLVALGGQLVLAWVEQGEGGRGSRLRAARFPAGSLPAPTTPPG